VNKALTFFWTLLFVLSVIYVLLVINPHAHAQTEPSETLLLAQAMVLEADWISATDHAAIAHVLMRESKRAGVPLPSHIRRYVAGFKIKLPRNLMIRSLTAEGWEPEGWPQNLSWPKHQVWWWATIERAKRALAGTLPDPCRGRADHWGGDMDLGRAERAGWVRVDCGDTANTFWERQ
jgi:hypothetical protein